MDRRAWKATVHRVAQSQIWLKWLCTALIAFVEQQIFIILKNSSVLCVFISVPLTSGNPWTFYGLHVSVFSKKSHIIGTIWYVFFQIVVFHLVICISRSSVCLHHLILHFLLVLHNNPLSGCTVVTSLLNDILCCFQGLAIMTNHKHLLEKAMVPNSSTLAWKIPWTEEPGRLLRVWHDWATSLSLSLSCIGEGNGNPLLPGESQGGRSLVGCSLWGCTESDTTEATAAA